MKIKSQYIIFLIGLSVLLLAEAAGSWQMAEGNLDYNDLIYVKYPLYFVLGIIVTWQSNAGIAIIGIMIVAFLNGAVGWRIAFLIHPYTPWAEDLSVFTLWILIALIEMLKGGFIGAMGATVVHFTQN